MLPIIKEIEPDGDLLLSLREFRSKNKSIIAELLKQRSPLYLGFFITKLDKVRYYTFDSVADFTFFPADPEDRLQIYYQELERD